MEKRTATYLFTSERLGFRAWKPDDLSGLSALCADEAVMRYFPAVLDAEESKSLFDRLIDHHRKHGFTYFAVDRLDSHEFIGFIGLARQDYESYFTPCVDIGWRLKRAAWGKGFATEGAKACLQHAFGALELNEIYAVTTHNNTASERVMQKIGMQPLPDFIHPKLPANHALQPMVVYRTQRVQK
ncbi:MAG: GNAT family N-acetyltransferase [Bacteroidota bacterium]